MDDSSLLCSPDASHTPRSPVDRAGEETNDDADRARPRTILVGRELGEIWLACREGGETVELSVLPDDGRFATGAVYTGKVARLGPAGGGAFVDIGDAESLFVPRPVDPESGTGWAAGQRVLVQVVRARDGRKGRRGDGRIAVAGAGLVLLPRQHRRRISGRVREPAERERLSSVLERLNPAGHGIIARAGAAGMDERRLREELSGLLARWQAAESNLEGASGPSLVLAAEPPSLVFVRDRVALGIDAVIGDDPAALASIAALGIPGTDVRAHTGPLPLIDAYRLDGVLDAALRPEVPLPGGGRIVVQRTEAMTTIDVDSGAASSGTDSGRDALEIDREAAAAIARATRLRNITGTVAIDFIGVGSASRRAAIDRALADAMRGDLAVTEVSPLTRSGIALVVRRYRGPALAEPLTVACPCCGGARVPTHASRARRLLRTLRRLARPDPGGRYRIRGPAGVVEEARSLHGRHGDAAGLPPAHRVTFEEGDEAVGSLGQRRDDGAGA